MESKRNNIMTMQQHIKKLVGNTFFKSCLKTGIIN